MRIVVAMILALVAGCAPKPAVPEKPLNTLDGTITYRQRVALSPDAIVKVWLQDVSKMDAVAEVLDEVEIRNPGQVPIAFRVRYDPDRIVEKHRYTLLVKIYEGDRTRFLNATSYPVITQGCTDRCEIVLDMMQ
jgi:putative lipoprotein